MTSSLATRIHSKIAALKSDVILQPHQRDLLAKTRAQPTGGVIANWTVGAGKTPGAIAVAEDRGGPTLVVGPAALRNNFRDSVERFTTPDRHGQYHVTSYEQFAKDPHGVIDKVKPRTLILDEVHRLRKPDTAQKAVESIRGRVPFALGLTASLVNNHPTEIVPIVNLVAGKQIYKDQAEFSRQHISMVPQRKKTIGETLLLRDAPKVEGITDPAAIKKRVGPHVHRYFGDPAFASNFPAVERQDIDVPMSKEQWELYQNILKKNPNLAKKIKNNLPPSKNDLKNMNAFAVAVRQISNTPASFDMSVKDPVAASPKLTRMLAEQQRMAAQDPHYRAVVYSQFLESGVSPLARTLQDRGVKAQVFQGGMTDKKRSEMVRAFNRGDTKVLGISPAGGEGLDLKGVKLIQMTEDHWNPERGVQVEGRGNRFKSHAHLPPEHRKLVVQRFRSTAPKRFWHALIKPDTTIDQWVTERRKEKDRLNQQAVSAL